MSPQETAWERYHASGLSTDKPIGLMNAVLDAFAELAIIQEQAKELIPADSPCLICDQPLTARGSR